MGAPWASGNFQSIEKSTRWPAMSSLDFSLIGKGGLKDHLGLIFLELFASSRSVAEILKASSVAKSGKNSGKIKLVAFFSEAWTKRKNYNF